MTKLIIYILLCINARTLHNLRLYITGTARSWADIVITGDIVEGIEPVTEGRAASSNGMMVEPAQQV